jgi:hypothetical protein
MSEAWKQTRLKKKQKKEQRLLFQFYLRAKGYPYIQLLNNKTKEEGQSFPSIPPFLPSPASIMVQRMPAN